VTRFLSYLVLSFVALDEPSNLPRLALGQLLDPQISLVDVETDINELDKATDATIQLADDPFPAFVYHVESHLAGTAQPAASPPMEKGSAHLLTC
jgi:hypothetical protein